MISLSRILTKLLLPDERASTLIFFLVSVGLELLCFLLHLLVRRSRFVLYYTTRPRDSRRGCRTGYRVHHDVATGDIHFVSACARPGVARPLSLSPDAEGTSPDLVEFLCCCHCHKGSRSFSCLCTTTRGVHGPLSQWHPHTAD